MAGIIFLGVFSSEPKKSSLFDQIDLKILSLLQNHGRRRLSDIAKEVDLSSPAVIDRVKSFLASGVIKSYQAVLDAKRLRISPLLSVYPWGTRETWTSFRIK